MNDRVKSSWILNFALFWILNFGLKLDFKNHSVLGLQLMNNVIFISVSTYVEHQHKDAWGTEGIRSSSQFLQLINLSRQFQQKEKYICVYNCSCIEYKKKMELLFKISTLYAFSGWRGSGGTKDFTLLDPSLWLGPLTMCTLAPSARRCATGTAAASTAPSASATLATQGQPAK